MRWNRLLNQRGLSFLEILVYGALLVFVIYAGMKFFTNSDSQSPVRAYENPLTK